MALFTAANFLAFTDRIGALYDEAKLRMGLKSAGAVAGNLQNLGNNLLQLVLVTLDDYYQVSGTLDDAQSLFLNCSVDNWVKLSGLAAAAGDLARIIGDQGSSVSAAIVDIDTFLAWYNGGDGITTAYQNLVSPSFNEVWSLYKGTYLKSANQGTSATSATGVFSPGINPTNGQASGMGTISAGGSFVAGAAVTQNATAGQKSYCEVNLIAVVIANFANGGAAPQIAVTATDNTGVATAFNGTFGSNNPVAALATTLTPQITSAMVQTRQTVALASTAGVVAGSLLTVNSGLVDQETILVEAVAGSSITAVFKTAHAAGAAVTGNTTIALTPATAGRRARVTTAATLTLSGHNAGNVRIEGVQLRTAI